MRCAASRAKDAAKQAGHLSPKPYTIPANLLKSIDALAMSQLAGGRSAASASSTASAGMHAASDASNDWLTFNTPAASNATDTDGISAPWHPAKGPGGGAAQAPRGGTSAGRGIPSTGRGAIMPLRLPSPTASASTAGGASAALLAAVAGASSTAAASASPGTGAAAQLPRPSLVLKGTGASPGLHNPTGGGITFSADDLPGNTGSGGAAAPGSTPDPVTGNSSTVTAGVSTPFSVSVLDNQAGVVLYPNVDQFATLNGWMDLVAQVSGATVSSYSWNTTGLPATNISGTSTDQLNFRWDNTNSLGSGYQTSVTLSVTDTNSNTLTYTYDFWFPQQSVEPSGSGGGTNATWATSLLPSQELLSAPSFPSDNASVDATSGSLDTEIDLPSYNPNVHPSPSHMIR